VQLLLSDIPLLDLMRN